MFQFDELSTRNVSNDISLTLGEKGTCVCGEDGNGANSEKTWVCGEAGTGVSDEETWLSEDGTGVNNDETLVVEGIGEAGLMFTNDNGTSCDDSDRQLLVCPRPVNTLSGSDILHIDIEPTNMSSKKVQTQVLTSIFGLFLVILFSISSDKETHKHVHKHLFSSDDDVNK